MPEFEGKPKTVIADTRIEMFFNSVMGAALQQKLSDGEIVAILASMIGRMIGLAKPGIDQTTLLDTAAFNLANGRELAPKLRDALGKPN